MDKFETVLWVALALGLLNLLLLVALWLRRPRRPDDVPGRDELPQLLAPVLERSVAQHGERLERGLRQELGEGARTTRQELGQSLDRFQAAVTSQSAEALRTQNAQIDALGTQLTQLRGTLAQQLLETRGTLADTLVAQLQALGLSMTQQAQEATRTQNAQIDAFAQQLTLLQRTLGDTLNTQLHGLTESNARRLQEVRTTTEQLLGQLQHTHAGKLDEVTQSTLAARRQQTEQLAALQTALLQQGAEGARSQAARLEAFAQQIGQLRQSLAEALNTQLQAMGEVNTRRMAEVRQTMEQQLAQLQASNAAKLDEMRQTVDEKLQSTLETRLGESFKQVAERLELVHRGLGEMQTLAQGVGDLKHLLTNVKTRGMFGEAQLGALLEQVFSPDQYGAQVCTRPGGRNAVDYAIRLPGRGGPNGSDAPVWLPIDAKFPNEDYERLLDAQQRADAAAAETAGKALEARIRLEARSINDKYIEPPHTTDFAILFLPTEGLYAEVLRRPGLMESLQREQRVTLAGPTTLLAMLSSLQMGFRTLALEKRSSEVWQVLGAVKTEFGKFGDVLAKVKKQTQTVLNTLDETERRTRAVDRKLRGVEALPEADAQELLPGMAEAPEPADD